MSIAKRFGWLLLATKIVVGSNKNAVLASSFLSYLWLLHLAPIAEREDHLNCNGSQVYQPNEQQVACIHIPVSEDSWARKSFPFRMRPAVSQGLSLSPPFHCLAKVMRPHDLRNFVLSMQHYEAKTKRTSHPVSMVHLLIMLFWCTQH